MRKITEIIVHCSATPEGQNFTTEDIDHWHKQKGWQGIGYHYVIELDGSVHKGRNEEVIGAHCLGHNVYSIGVCYIGGLDKWTKAPKDTRTDAQKQALIDLLKRLKEKYPNAIIYGHRDFSKKNCPCFDAKNEYKNI